ncbi:MAG: AAA family ATPase [Bacteroidales bacterium]|nr:AAA family ATPase [Bacteroidales bacterium]
MVERRKESFRQNILRNLGFSPTPSQDEAVACLADFIYGKGENFLFLLKGYAGTGKTSLVSALVEALEAIKVKIVLLAPTGRAAKVLSQYSGRKAYTIHKWIYRTYSKDGVRKFVRRENKHDHTLFIVDEASMIPLSNAQNDSSTLNLLDDLMDFVYLGRSNRMLFVGDDAQLPPVGAPESPALDPAYLRSAYSVDVFSTSMKDVVRQSLDSGILVNATLLRNKISSGDCQPPYFKSEAYDDFVRVSGAGFEELLNELYGSRPMDEVVTVTRSNKRAVLFNNSIRNRILFRENRLSAGDYIMAVKNNYYWLDELSEAGFLANGDIMEVLSVHKQQEIYGFHFADVTVRLCDYRDHPNVDIKIILESLDFEGPSLSYEESRRLYDAVAEDYEGLDPRAKFLRLKNDPYVNAVQVKFAYSMTCHKTQGGQWSHVIVDQGFFQADFADREYMRWLYTAVTRGTAKVYLLDFSDEMFG